MPCKKHSAELEGRSDIECEACYDEDQAEMAYWRQLYEGEKQAGLVGYKYQDDEDGWSPYRDSGRERFNSNQ